jgi:hypothetical protein
MKALAVVTANASNGNDRIVAQWFSAFLGDCSGKIDASTTSSEQMR